jgi:Icc-related predicted phosphoesterase
MKFLAISDIHGSKKSLKELKEKSKQVDIVLLAGDFTVFENDIHQILKKINSWKRKTFLIQGNHETPEVVEAVSAKYPYLIYLDERYYIIDNYLFIGIEGNGFTKKDEYFEEVSKEFLPIIKEHRKEFGTEAKIILMTHAPPYNTKCDVVAGEHAGNNSIRKFISKSQPDLCVCGHIHESAGNEDFIKKTLVVNAGKKGKIIDL